MDRTWVRRVVGRLVAAAVLALAFVPMLAALGAQAQGLPEFKVVKLIFDGILDEQGNLAVTASWKFPTNAEYLNAKKMYPSPNVLFREIFTGRSAFLVENAKASYNDAANSVAMSARFTGAAALRVRQWELDMGKGLDLAWQDGERLVLVQVVPLEPYYLMAKYKIVLPKKATSAKYSAESGLITYTLPVPAARGDAVLDVELKCKPRVMSAAYKVYGNSDVGAGSFWVAKTAFRNVGKGNIRDLQVSYKLGEYSDWSEPRSYAAIVPDGTVVDLYYPIISSRVAELRTPTPVDVSVRCTYKDEAGRSFSRTESKRISLLGINQMEFSNILPEESTGTWTDSFSNAPVLAAFATRLDEPVKGFAGLASQLSGGVSASATDEEAVAFCKAVYDLELAHGISYQTPSGFLMDYSPGQDVKFPRDVLRDKAGTCVDLALLYASTCEAVGLGAYVLVIPGHAYPIIKLPSGSVLPVETTGVGGAAIGKASSFEEAVKIAQKNLPKDTSEKPHYLVDLEEMWSLGVTNPELPKLDADVLQKWGYGLQAVARAAGAAPAAGAAQAPAQQAPQQAVPTQPGQPAQPTQPATAPTVPAVQPGAGAGAGAAPAATASLTGTYRGVIVITQGPTLGQGVATVTLQQMGSAIQGSFRFEPPAQGYGTIQGVVAGDEVTFTLNLAGFLYQFAGAVDEGVIDGRFQSAQTGEAGEFHLERIAPN